MRISLRGTGDGVQVRMRLEVNRRRWLTLLIILGVLTFQAFFVGLWATFAPESWYNSFPGLGMRWVRGDGPYNHHLAADVGAFFLALGAITAVALWYRDSVLARAAGLGWLVFGVPHFIYHLLHPADGVTGFGLVLNVLATLAIPLLGLACILVAPRERYPVPEPAPLHVKFPRRRPPASR
ncbi:hypothetical protein [Nocardia acididurans]|nr:hypothetical protein [Nocardia acididurans]